MNPKLQTRLRRASSLAFALAAIAVVPGCSHPDDARRRDDALAARVDHIVVIYAENRSFDNLFGHFPGARGLDEVIDHDGHPLPAYVRQRDRDGSILATLPPTWGGVT